MEKIHKFYNTEIDEKFFEEFVNVINDFNYDSKFKKLVIYFSSHGGITTIADAVVDLINKNANKIELVGFDNLQSSGLKIFLKSKCSKRILPNTFGMIHLSRITVEVSSNGLFYNDDDKFIINKNRVGEYNDEIEFIKKLNLTTEQFNNVIYHNKEVYFTDKELTKLLKDEF